MTKRILLLLTAILLLAAAADAQWTVVQHPNFFTCTGSTSGNHGCTVTATATGANHLLILLSAAFEGQTGTNHIAPTFVSASGDSTWTHCPNSYAHLEYTTNSFENTDCAYVLKSAGGATSFTFTWSFPATTNAYAIDVELLELSVPGGTFFFDADNNTTSASCSSCVAPSVTLGGNGEYIATWIAQQQSITSISAPYTNPAADIENVDVAGGFAGAINQSSGTGPTWTCTAGAAAMSTIAFKVSSGGKAAVY